MATEQGGASEHAPLPSHQDEEAISCPVEEKEGNIVAKEILITETVKRDGFGSGESIIGSKPKRDDEDPSSRDVIASAKENEDGASEKDADSTTCPRKQRLFYRCDACLKQPLLEVRFHCQECDDFDLCMECYVAPEPKHLITHLATMKRLKIGNEFESAVSEPEEGSFPKSSSNSGKKCIKASRNDETPKVTSSALEKILSMKNRKDDEPRELQSESGENSNGKRDRANGHATEAEDVNGNKHPDTNFDLLNVPERVKRRRKNANLGGEADIPPSERMNSLLQECGIHEFALGRVNTRIPEDFMRFFEVGWEVYSEAISKYTGTSQLACIRSHLGQIIALNTIAFMELPQARLREEFDLGHIHIGIIKSILFSIIKQFMLCDEDGWFGEPVPPDEPDYHEIIENPMDLGTLYQMLKDDVCDTSSIESLFQDVTGNIFLIWRNAMVFNPKTHEVHKQAHKNAELAVEVLSQAAAQLELDIPHHFFTFTYPRVKSKKGNRKKNANGQASPAKKENKNKTNANQKKKGPKARIDSSHPNQTTRTHTEIDNSTSRDELLVQIATLQSGLANANQRIDQLLEFIDIGLGNMRGKLSNLTNF